MNEDSAITLQVGVASAAGGALPSRATGRHSSSVGRSQRFCCCWGLLDAALHNRFSYWVFPVSRVGKKTYLSVPKSTVITVL